MKTIAVIIFISFYLNCQGNSDTTIYLLPGQGSNRHIFDSLVFNENYKIKIIEYGTPAKNANMKSFALQLSQQIDTSTPFILIGVSLGGMICVELNEILSPVKTIIISSAKNRNELPFKYRFQKVFPIYKVFPGFIMLWGAKLLQPIVEPDRNKFKKTFKSMLASKNPLYMKRAIRLILTWDRITNNKSVYHIHGNNDHTIPIRNVKNINYTIINGSHMIALTRAAEINKIIALILKN